MDNRDHPVTIAMRAFLLDLGYTEGSYTGDRPLDNRDPWLDYKIGLPGGYIVCVKPQRRPYTDGAYTVVVGTTYVRGYLKRQPFTVMHWEPYMGYRGGWDYQTKDQLESILRLATQPDAGCWEV